MSDVILIFHGYIWGYIRWTMGELEKVIALLKRDDFDTANVDTDLYMQVQGQVHQIFTSGLQIPSRTAL